MMCCWLYFRRTRMLVLRLTTTLLMYVIIIAYMMYTDVHIVYLYEFMVKMGPFFIFCTLFTQNRYFATIMYQEWSQFCNNVFFFSGFFPSWSSSVHSLCRRKCMNCVTIIVFFFFFWEEIVTGKNYSRLCLTLCHPFRLKLVLLKCEMRWERGGSYAVVVQNWKNALKAVHTIFIVKSRWVIFAHKMLL